MKYFQISTDDLALLENDIPAICDRQMSTLTKADKAAIRRIQQVLTRVRWNYGPPQYVETLPAGDSPDDGIADET